MQQVSYFPSKIGSSKLLGLESLKVLGSNKLLTNQMPLSYSSKYFIKNILYSQRHKYSYERDSSYMGMLISDINNVLFKNIKKRYRKNIS